MKIRCTYDKLVPISELKPYPKNPNEHSEEQINRLAQILDYQGWRYPVKVSNLSGYITSGHGRIDAAQKNGWTEVPVNFQDYESEEQEYADVVSDNSIAEWANLNLSQINADVVELGPDFDIDLLGIKDFVLEPSEKYDDEKEDAVPEDVPAIIKPGDLWILGNHRLLCGDCTVQENVDRLMDGERADMVFTDPPYGIGYRYNQHDDSSSEENSKLVSEAFSHHSCGKVWTPGKMNLERDFSRFGKAKIAIWYKKFAQAGSGLGGASTFEPILVVNPKEKKLNNDVLVVPTERETIDGQSLRELHSCPKPVGLYSILLESFSLAGDKIVEPFCGSGSTLIACEKTNRKCYGMEIDPHYCDVIVKRWEEYTGKVAHLENSNGNKIF